MNLFLDSFWRAVAYCVRPRVIALSFLPLILMVALSLGLGYFYWDVALDWVRSALDASAIVTTMLMIQRQPLPQNYIIAAASIALALGASWVVFAFSAFFLRVLGARGSLILAKLMGILVTAIGTHYVLQGLHDFCAR